MSKRQIQNLTDNYTQDEHTRLIVRVACYIRVSTQEQKLHGISLDAQRDKLKEYAEKHHLKIVAWYEDDENTNNVFLEGYICKPPVYRSTPLGREITDFSLAVNRIYGKTDYIPCITWGRNAKYLSTLPVGTHLKICGRVQSREYVKDNVAHTAYELSVISLEVLKEEL